MKKIILPIIAIACALSVQAQDEILKIQLANGEIQTIAVKDIQEMTFDDDSQETSLNGTYSGNVTVVIGGQFTYNSTATYNISDNIDGKLNLIIDQYTIPATVMGDMCLGAITIDDISYNATTDTYLKMYGGNGVKRHLTAVNNGNTTMDADYDVKDGSEISVKAEGNNIIVTDSFRIGNMPFPLVATFTGVKVQ